MDHVGGGVVESGQLPGLIICCCWKEETNKGAGLDELSATTHFSSIELDDSRYEDGKYYYAKAKLCELWLELKSSEIFCIKISCHS